MSSAERVNCMATDMTDHNVHRRSSGSSIRYAMRVALTCLSVFMILHAVQAEDVIPIGALCRINCSVLDVSKEPGGEIIASLPNGWIVEIMSAPRQAVLGDHTYTWYAVESAMSSTSIGGWIVADHLLRIDPAALAGGMTPLYVSVAHDTIVDAINDGRGEVGSTNWYNSSTGMTYCLGFVGDMYGVTGGLSWSCPGDEAYSCPNGGVAILRRSQDFFDAGASWNPPSGALIFFTSVPIGGVEYGHIGIHLGDGRVVNVSPSGSVAIDSITDAATRVGGSYLGWAFPPEEWLGNTKEVCSFVGTWSGQTTYERVDEALNADGSSVGRVTGPGALELRISAEAGVVEGELRMILDGDEGPWMAFTAGVGEGIAADNCQLNIDLVLESSQTHSVGPYSVIANMQAVHEYSFTYQEGTLVGYGTATIYITSLSSNSELAGTGTLTVTLPNLTLERIADAGN